MSWRRTTEAQRSYMTASLAAGLVTPQQVWTLTTGHTAIVSFQNGQVKYGSDVGGDVFLGEQKCDEWNLVVMSHNAEQRESILLGAGEGWPEAETLLRENGGLAEQLTRSECCQYIVDTVAAASAGAVAGLLAVRERFAAMQYTTTPHIPRCAASMQ
jgi:hypothetical protein